MTGSRRVVMWLPMVAALLVLGAYALLLPGGKWQGDDYLGAWFVDRNGWHVLLDRLLGRSPRPVAETLSWLYFSASNRFDRPLIATFLGLLWLASLAGVVMAGWVGRVRRPVLLALTLFALTLLLIQPGEMFYWPEGAAAYLPCWAGLAAVTILHRAELGRHRIALTVALLVAVFSAEVGAITVLFFALLSGAACLRERRLHRIGPFILPALCAVAVCAIVWRNRMQPMSEVFDTSSGLGGNWAASLRAAVPTFGWEAAGIEGLPLLAGVAIKLVLVSCLPHDQRPPAPASRQAALWACALLLGAFASVVLAYHEFGALCCQRHATLRQGMVLLALTACAGLLGGALPMSRQILLAAVLCGLLAIRSKPLLADWRALPEIVSARQRNWTSGKSRGDAMTLLVAPPGRITNSDALPLGRFRRETDEPFGDTPWYAWGVMARFGKHELEVRDLAR